MLLVGSRFCFPVFVFVAVNFTFCFILFSLLPLYLLSMIVFTCVSSVCVYFVSSFLSSLFLLPPSCSLIYSSPFLSVISLDSSWVGFRFYFILVFWTMFCCWILILVLAFNCPGSILVFFPPGVRFTKEVEQTREKNN